MSSLLELLPWFTAMALLIALSAFFSASEAALFYLRPGERRRLEQGNRSQRLAAQLLNGPDRLLSAVLFWNLVVNIIYFALSSVIALQIEENENLGSVFAVGFVVLSLVTIIFFSEMMPKSIAVLRPMMIAQMVSIPLSIAIRVTDPVMPLLRGLTKVSRRIIWPGFKPEQYMELADLERAIQISSADESIVRQEQAVLQNIVSLSDVQVKEWMRPRTKLQIFSPPVSLIELQGAVTKSGYLLIAEEGSDEIEKAFRLDSVTMLRNDSIEKLAHPVAYLPWTATVAVAFEQMQARNIEVTAVVNEFGETVGVLTIEDILQSVFAYQTSRSERLLQRNPIQKVAAGCWRVPGLLSLKQLSRRFGVDLPVSRSVTVSGVIQEQTQQLPEVGDSCQWGPFQFQVVTADNADDVTVELRYTEASKTLPAKTLPAKNLPAKNLPANTEPSTDAPESKGRVPR